ncbi:sigma factor [Micromonospora taraxaci]|uniref:Sigma-70-like protein n=1 Tax=Micromonospora taraxaci TaxID=1316803 RepID=A0A561W7B4_9ACTN|nr:sigma-70-like protein [Micromonospora taraxaci]
MSENRRQFRSNALPSAFCVVVAERRLLKNLAFHLVGSVGAAEQAVRETYTGWYTMPEDQRDRIDNPFTWLVGTLVRVCVGLLESSPPRAGGPTADPAGRPRVADPTPQRWGNWRDAPML